ncbi:hypothetical protein A2311_04260 [candidate division WOR-1 bacterium RIFOXYB2_FULL_48_7]|uniref:Uncharacterized protein n=1 Tax=candidate division WOR-1 bacterium RIFOXYB2_FULL_48_7 TaxID=1802583 RepID=A0A1F4TW59_UNCSA|nr:MAG: hypothetical protein A2311_04260 [candidate division WOR-1 bacterium RIFOXYB2_FULL_48_7]
MAMSRPRFDGLMEVTGGRMTALIRQRAGVSLRETVAQDRSFLKLTNAGTLEANTASPYAYSGHVADVAFDDSMPGRVKVVGADGRVLNIDYVAIPETNRGLAELADLDFLVDATGVGVKDIKKTPDQDPNFYTEYPGLTVLFSCPVKTVKGIPHLFNGVSYATPGQLNATGSCTTHAGVDLIRYIREPLMQSLGLSEGELIIEGGLLDTTHSLTPTDISTLQYYNGACVAQTTGFGGAAGKVYPVAGIKNINAATNRYESFYDVDGIRAAGTSMFSLSMVVSVRKGMGEVTQELIEAGLRRAAQDPEGRKHIGVINSVFELDKNKKTGILTTLSLSGMTPTTMLPLGDNIKVVKMGGTLVKDGIEYESYVVTVKNAAYDNRLGFTVDMLEEANEIAQASFGTQLIPGFDHQQDVGDALAFVRSAAGQRLFAKALEVTGGQLLKP